MKVGVAAVFSSGRRIATLSRWEVMLLVGTATGSLAPALSTRLDCSLAASTAATVRRAAMADSSLDKLLAPPLHAVHITASREKIAKVYIVRLFGFMVLGVSTIAILYFIEGC